MDVSLAGLSLRDLEYALAVARHRHFGRAAASCGVSQPGLSEQIRKLEGLLGVTLFERSRRAVAPTPEGAPVLRQAELVVREARSLLGMRAERQRGGALGTVRAGVIPTLGPYYLPFLLRSVRARFPVLDLVLTEARTTELLDALRTGRLDVAICATPLPAGDAFVASPLFDEPFHLAVPAGHALEGRTDVAVGDLVGDELLLLEDGHCLRDQAVDLCRLVRGGGTAVRARSASSLEMLRHMIAAGEGYSLLPVLAAHDGRNWDGLVVTRPLPEREARRRIALVWRRTDPRGGKLGEVAAFLRENAPPETEAPDPPVQLGS